MYVKKKSPVAVKYLKNGEIQKKIGSFFLPHGVYYAVISWQSYVQRFHSHPVRRVNNSFSYFILFI